MKAAFDALQEAVHRAAQCRVDPKDPVVTTIFNNMELDWKARASLLSNKAFATAVSNPRVKKALMTVLESPEFLENFENDGEVMAAFEAIQSAVDAAKQ